MKRIAVAIAAALISHMMNAVFCEGSSEYYAYLAVYRLPELVSIIARLENSSFKDDRKELKKIKTVMKSSELKEYCKRHVQLTICNLGSELVKITYSKMTQYTDPIKQSLRRRMVNPESAIQIIIPKNKSIQYREQELCPDDCTNTDEHYHWGEKYTVYYQDSHLIYLGNDITGQIENAQSGDQAE